jgi:hypothetical protein
MRFPKESDEKQAALEDTFSMGGPNLSLRASF